MNVANRFLYLLRETRSFAFPIWEKASKQRPQMVIRASFLILYYKLGFYLKVTITMLFIALTHLSAARSSAKRSLNFPPSSIGSLAI